MRHWCPKLDNLEELIPSFPLSQGNGKKVQFVGASRRVDSHSNFDKFVRTPFFDKNTSKMIYCHLLFQFRPNLVASTPIL